MRIDIRPFKLRVRSSNAAVIEFYRDAGLTSDYVISLGKRLEAQE